MSWLGSDTPFRLLASFIMVGLVWLIGCAASEAITPNPIGKALLGKSKQELVSCAGPSLQETVKAEGIVLTYYKEAPMFEESSPASKGSRPGVHHGCWAHLLMKEDRVEGVEFKSVPPSVNATDHCEQIFHACVQ